MVSIVETTDVRQAFADRFSVYADNQSALSLIEWGREFLPHFFYQKPSGLHRWLSDELGDISERRGVGICVVGPRESAKSTIGTVAYALRQAVEGREPFTLIVSDTKSQAVEQIRAIKEELETNGRLREIYPSAVGIGPIWQHAYVKLRNGCVLQAVGTGSKIRGVRKSQHRPSLIILDDPENDSHIDSERQRDKIRTWFRRTLMNTGDKNTNVVAMGTALHRDCLILTLMRSSGWVTRREKGKPSAFRAIETWPERMDLWNDWESIYLDVDNPKYIELANRFYKRNKTKMDKGARLLWPGRETLYGLMVKRADIGHSAFEAEKQGNPVDPTTCEWPEGHFTHDKFWADRWPDNVAITIVSVDPSKGKDANRSDYSAITVIKITNKGHVYFESDLERRPTEAIISRALELYERHDAAGLVIETNQYQELLAEELRREATDRDLDVNVIEVDNRVKKTVRIRRLGPLLEKKRLHPKTKSPGTAKAVQQIRDFPNADFDDGPDGLEMGVRIGFRILNDDPTPETVIGQIEIE